MIRIIESQFVKSAVKPDQYPEGKYAELAFAGRSNVGKSSLINTLLNRKSLAKVSRQPGKTRLVNFFNVRFKKEEEDGFFSLVDLPGYGFAKVSEAERKSWQTMIESYFRTRIEIRGVFLLVDISHSANSKDIVMVKMLQQMGKNFVVIATKSDKIAQNKIPSTLKKLKSGLGLRSEKILPFSSLKKTGQAQVINWIEQLIL